jgi:glycerophosphoryl diester phosphodiesterase
MPKGDTMVSGVPAMRRVGHKGADLIAPGNTLASFDAALAAGVDMIEFDVLPERETGRLVLAHDYKAAGRVSAPSLEDGLAHFRTDAYAGIELDVDLKLPGYEDRVVEALRSSGLIERSLVSSQYIESLDRIRAMEPGLRLGWSVPRLRRDYTRNPATAVPAFAVLLVYRALLPGRAARAIRDGRCDALMAHWRLVTPRLVRAIDAAGGDLFVWTVDDLGSIRRLAALGVSGVITNDPRLFGALA